VCSLSTRAALVVSRFRALSFVLLASRAFLRTSSARVFSPEAAHRPSSPSPPPQDLIDVKGAMDFVAACKNFDGGFGATPGDESHAGQIFTAVGALAIGDGLHHVDRDLLGWWLCERQVKGGGLNGASHPPAAQKRHKRAGRAREL
jgi:hypothetical protein